MGTEEEGWVGDLTSFLLHKGGVPVIEGSSTVSFFYFPWTQEPIGVPYLDGKETPKG